ncbi:hypothetical protein BDP27DRAFT_1421429 [Rhodocollybia butyracea]|uniref:Uncharacterized protein n=1 Tax=Rhodocollybia butyracea TaxID=206335 RepID=A0A9P5U7P3_9AGAR|nr:hypothetical protein BDP27DRAFT_1421429 [Rhodocollybia butyracea]
MNISSSARSLRNLLVYFTGFILLIHVHAVRVLNVTTLGPDPQTVNRLNGESFQQDPSPCNLTFQDGFQYAVLWVPTANVSVRHAAIRRRLLPDGDWEGFEFSDYNQTDDDGHDIISMGISRGDGTIHLIWDEHDANLNYRSSFAGVATNPTKVNFTADLFSPLTSFLPGLESLDPNIFFINVTYPRFLQIPKPKDAQSPDLVLEIRVGQAGEGDDWLYHYTPTTHSSPGSRGNWTLVGRYLEGVNNNAYINGLDFSSKQVLQTTWTYRDFVPTNGQDVAVEAGPNGPENNHDMNFAYSPDLGYTWHNNWGQIIGDLKTQVPIVPASAAITMFGIPKFGGILNQEAQTLDSQDRMHVLNRENTTGIEQWYHYWRSTDIDWTRITFPLSLAAHSINNITRTPTPIGKRGKLAVPTGSDTLLAILPSNAPNSTGLSILSSTSQAQFKDWKILWEVASGCGFEPLFDRYRLNTEDGGDGILSMYLINGTEVVVMDLDLQLGP